MNSDDDETYSWPKRKEKTIHKRELIRKAKVAGTEHISHKGTHVNARQIGDDCRYVFICIFDSQDSEVIGNY